MRLVLLCLTTSLIALSGPSAAAQGAAAVASTRVSFTIPERRFDASVDERRSGALESSRDALPAVGASRSVGQNVRPICGAILQSTVIGTLSVSCLETAAPGERPAGVALELVSAPGAGESLEIVLDDGAAITLHAREVVGFQSASANGLRVLRASLPAAAFERIAASRSVTILAHGNRHVLSAVELHALRQIAQTL